MLLNTSVCIRRVRYIVVAVFVILVSLHPTRSFTPCMVTTQSGMMRAAGGGWSSVEP